MIRIIGLLGTNLTALMDEDDYQALEGYRYYHDPTGVSAGYVMACKRGETLIQGQRLHTVLIGHHDGLHVDHIDGNGLNNTRHNLRVVTHQSNQVNRQKLNKNNTTGIRGVHLVKRRAHLQTPWKAVIEAGKKTIHIGYFATVDEAAAARRHAELKYFGELCPTSKEQVA